MRRLSRTWGESRKRPPSVPSPPVGHPSQDVPRAAAARGPAARGPLLPVPGCSVQRQQPLCCAHARPSLFPAPVRTTRPSMPWGPQQRFSAPRGCPGTSPRPLVALLGRAPCWILQPMLIAHQPWVPREGGGALLLLRAPRSWARRGGQARGPKGSQRPRAWPAPCSSPARADSSLWPLVLSCVSLVLLPRGLGSPFPQAAASVLPETCRLPWNSSEVFLWGPAGA